MVVAEGCCNNAVDFSASLHSHTTWGDGAPGGWGGIGGLDPRALPPVTTFVDPHGPNSLYVLLAAYLSLTTVLYSSLPGYSSTTVQYCTAQ